MSFDLSHIHLTHLDKLGLLVGSWFSSVTLGIEIVQLYHYFASFPNDHLVLKSAVAFIFADDITASVLFSLSAHRQLVSVRLGSIEEYIPSLTLVCIPFFTSTMVASVNLFLIWRYHKLTQRLCLCLGLCAVVLASLSCHIWATSLAVKLRSLNISDLRALSSLLSQTSKAGKANLAMEVTLVCLIWLLILAHLLGLLRRDMQDAKRIVVRLLLLTAESGTVASVISIAALLYYLQNATSSNLIVLAFFMSRVYFMNMLFNLNVRKTGQVMRDASLTNRTHHTTGTNNHSGSLPLSHLRSSRRESAHVPRSIVHVSQHIEMKIEKEPDSTSSV